MAEEKVKIVKSGDKVSVDYEGRFEDGKVFDSSSHGDHSHPLEFESGARQVIKGFDDAVIGMKVNEEKEFTINPEDAYGLVNDKLIQEVPKKSLPKGHEPKEGMTLVMKTSQGYKIPVRITNVTDDKVTLDLNHPLAGKTLIFKIKLISIT